MLDHLAQKKRSGTEAGLTILRCIRVSSIKQILEKKSQEKLLKKRKKNEKFSFYNLERATEFSGRSRRIEEY